ncbi:MAG TPA: glycosyltransferase family 4 protein [Candidatus Solibacter sp.]|nr:glycosyltransferase family 4 protein [Candidatus Solibacter sp.]
MTHTVHTPELDAQQQGAEKLSVATTPTPAALSVCLLTGGTDRPYVYGLTDTLSSMGMSIDLIGSDELDETDLRNMAGVNFLNLRGDQRPNAGFVAKFFRVLAYYSKLIAYAASAQSKIFHILWNNKFETFDRTFLMLYYKLLGKRVVLTAHNVNKRRRDSRDSFLNRLTLRIQYRLADHIFVHTEKMKAELMNQFGVSTARSSVIPFGINNSVPNTDLTSTQAKERLGVRENEKAILFFGRIKPYKGLEYLIAAFQKLARRSADYRLIIVGRLEEGCERYWESIQKEIREYFEAGRVTLRIEFIPDSEIEEYFKASDVLILPYKEIFQSGVVFLGYSFGLPAIIADVGSLKDDVVEGKNGFVFCPEDPNDLARAIEQYFRSDLFADLNTRRQVIRDYALQRHSWAIVGQQTLNIYQTLSGKDV